MTVGVPPARAEQAWQLQLPRSWRVLSQAQAPPLGEDKPVALVVAGSPEIGGELSVLRIPLPSDPKDPSAVATKDIVEYFSKGGVQIDKVVDAVVKPQKSSPGLTKFDITGKPVDVKKGSRRYVRYDYQSSICPGSVVQGVSGNTCQRPDTGEDLRTDDRRHAITLTVTPEDSQGAVNYLWLLDVSGPAEAWEVLKEAVDTVSSSFELASEDQLEQARTAEVTPEQLEALKELQKAGKLPQDGGFFR